MQRTGSIVANGGGIIVESAILFMVETDMNSAPQFWKVPIQISEKEFDVAAKDFNVFIREVSLGPVCLQVFGAEHPYRALRLETGQGKGRKRLQAEVEVSPKRVG